MTTHKAPVGGAGGRRRALIDVFVVGASAGGPTAALFRRAVAAQGPDVLSPAAAPPAAASLAAATREDGHLPTLVGARGFGAREQSEKGDAFGGDSVKQACAGDEHSVVTTTGSVGTRMRLQRPVRARVRSNRRASTQGHPAVDRDVVVEIAAGEEHTLARAADGTLYAFGALAAASAARRHRGRGHP